MHTLQSEAIVFDDSPACHESITNTLTETIELLTVNCVDQDLRNDIVGFMIRYSNNHLSELAEQGKSTDVLIQVVVERPTLVMNNKGMQELACLVGIYGANRSEDTDDDGTRDGQLLYSFALLLDPETRQIIDQCLTDSSTGSMILQ